MSGESTKIMKIAGAARAEGARGCPMRGVAPGTMVRDADRRLMLQRGLCRYSACVQVDPGCYRWECGAPTPGRSRLPMTDESSDNDLAWWMAADRPDPAEHEDIIELGPVDATRPIGPMSLRNPARRPYLLAGVAAAALLAGGGAAPCGGHPGTPGRRAERGDRHTDPSCICRTGRNGAPLPLPVRPRRVWHAARPVRDRQVRGWLPDRRRAGRTGHGRKYHVDHAEELGRLHKDLRGHELHDGGRAARRNRLGEGWQPGFAVCNGQRQHRHSDERRRHDAAAAGSPGIRELAGLRRRWRTVRMRETRGYRVNASGTRLAQLPGRVPAPAGVSRSGPEHRSVMDVRPVLHNLVMCG